MSNLKARLLKMEAHQKIAPLNEAELDRRLDELLAKVGIPRDQVIDEHGSLTAQAYALMRELRASLPIDLNDQRSPEQR